MNSSIQCWESDGCGWVRVVGGATFQNAGEVRDFGKKVFHRGLRNFVVDLAECTLLDSTFMGTLAGIALRLREVSDGQRRLRVSHASPEHDKQMRDLGLEQLFEME